MQPSKFSGGMCGSSRSCFLRELFVESARRSRGYGVSAHTPNTDLSVGSVERRSHSATFRDRDRGNGFSPDRSTRRSNSEEDTVARPSRPRGSEAVVSRFWETRCPNFDGEWRDRLRSRSHAGSLQCTWLASAPRRGTGPGLSCARHWPAHLEDGGALGRLPNSRSVALWKDGGASVFLVQCVPDIGGEGRLRG